MNDERVPPEMSKVSQQDLTYIAEFLQGFDKIELSANTRKTVNLEKLGQYLREDPLQTCFSPEGSEWASMLVDSNCLRNHPLIIKQDFEGSLLQAHTTLATAVNHVFTCAYQDLTKLFKQKIVSLTSASGSLSSQLVTHDGNLLIAVPSAECKILQLFKISCEEKNEPLISQLVQINLNTEAGINLNNFLNTHNKLY